MKFFKAYVALAGSIATALLGVYTADSTLGQVLTVVSVVATAFGTWAAPNKVYLTLTDNVLKTPLTERGDDR